MTVDIPADVAAVLTQLFGEAREAFERDDVETGVSVVTSAASVARNKLPESRLRARLLHGCERAEAVATADDNDARVAAEYVASMEQLLAEATGE
jgi:hypothetical protein